MAKRSRYQFVVAFVDPVGDDEKSLRAAGVDQFHTELAPLYQQAKESRIDLILVDDSRSDMTKAVAAKLRRKNGLTEIWRLTDEELGGEPTEVPFDGFLARGLGADGWRQKIDSILAGKELLDSYGLVGRSQRMKAMAETVKRVAPTEMSVMIVGPSGSGKELIAQAIHNNSARHEGSLVAVNCGALAEGVLESELFGHERGAFTGSVGKRSGLFHKANGGTIFLDEIGDTKPEMQVKLLRVLEDGTYYPVGSSTAHKADVRVISATNRDLTEAIAERDFREDLYFRIAVVKVVVPPLLDRKEDIQSLLQHFWNRHPELSVSQAALERLMQYDWPGNVRQLRNFAEGMVALVGAGKVESSDVDQFLEEQHSAATNLPVSTGKTVEEAGQELIYRAILSLGNEIRLLRDLITANLPSEEVAAYQAHVDAATVEPENPTMEEMERELIRKALQHGHGNRKRTAQRLGIGERTLYRKLKKYDLS
jgi:DNA-binding NtrC family response regulator